MYKVIKYFTDLQDQSHPYNVGDSFPRVGKEVTEQRLKELAGSNNRQHTPLIEEVPDIMPEPEVIPEIPFAEETPKPKKKRKSRVD